MFLPTVWPSVLFRSGFSRQYLQNSALLPAKTLKWRGPMKLLGVQVENQFVYRHFRQITPFCVNFEPFVLRRYYVS